MIHCTSPGTWFSGIFSCRSVISFKVFNSGAWPKKAKLALGPHIEAWMLRLRLEAEIGGWRLRFSRLFRELPGWGDHARAAPRWRNRPTAALAVKLGRLRCRQHEHDRLGRRGDSRVGRAFVRDGLQPAAAAPPLEESLRVDRRLPDSDSLTSQGCAYAICAHCARQGRPSRRCTFVFSWSPPPPRFRCTIRCALMLDHVHGHATWTWIRLLGLILFS